jgi:hypothetical protein
MPAGLNALQKAQAAIEATRGTGIAATRIVYLDRGAWFEQPVGREFPEEDRNSFIDNYRMLTVSHMAKVTAVARETFDDAPWWGQFFWKGGVTGVLSAITVYTYTFTPTVAVDDLKTMTLEVGNDTQAYQIPYVLGQKLEISWTRGQGVKMNVDLLGQRLIPQAFTGALSDRTLEDVVGTTAKVWIDNAGGTIGTTQALNVLGGKVSWDNNWTQITHLIGQLYPDDAQRGVRHLAIELDVHFNNTIEFAQLVAGGERLIRVQFTGTIIAGSTGNVVRSITIDFYGFYLSAPFSTDGPIRVVKLVGESVYDATATFDWKVAIACQLATLP